MSKQRAYYLDANGEACDYQFQVEVEISSDCDVQITEIYAYLAPIDEWVNVTKLVSSRLTLYTALSSAAIGLAMQDVAYIEYQSQISLDRDVDAFLGK